MKTIRYLLIINLVFSNLLGRFPVMLLLSPPVPILQKEIISLVKVNARTATSDTKAAVFETVVRKFLKDDWIGEQCTAMCIWRQAKSYEGWRRENLLRLSAKIYAQKGEFSAALYVLNQCEKKPAQEEISFLIEKEDPYRFTFAHAMQKEDFSREIRKM